MPVDKGPKAAARILSQMDGAQRKKILELMKQADQEMANLIEKNLVSLEDLRHISSKMLVSFLREVSISDLGLALRLVPKEVAAHIAHNVSKGLREEMEKTLLGPPVSAKKAMEASDRILAKMRQMVEKGELVLRQEDKLV